MARRVHFFDATKLHIVLSNKSRKPTILCWEKLCEIERYFGLHCDPILLASRKECWLYCFFVNLRNNTDNCFMKIVLEKQNDVLLVIVKPANEIFVEVFLNVCFLVDSVLDDVRAALMYHTNVFSYASIRRFINDIRAFNCTSNHVIWCTSERMFTSMYSE